MNSEDTELQIVIVEDDPNDAELISRALRTYHLANKLVLLKDGAEALDYLFGRGTYAGSAPDRQPKVILLDLKLPKIDGIEVLQQLKADARTRSIPVVILTSSREERDLKDAYNLGVNSYVTKPINFEEFAKAVADLGMYWLMLNKTAPDVSPSGRRS